MCKILAITNLKNIVLDQKTLESIKDVLCAYDRDGFGFAVSHEDKSVFQYRTTETKALSGIDSNRAFLLQGTTPLTLKVGRQRRETQVSGIFHGRMSTNSVSVDNTHPFALSSGGALIHNGVVYDDGYLDDLKTDCDTEILAVYWNIGGVNEIQTNVSGYAAMAILDQGQLHVIRDDRATLFMAWSQRLETFIIATTIDILKSIGSILNAELTDINRVNDNSHLIFESNTLVGLGEFTLQSDAVNFKGQDNSKVMAALGEVSSDDAPEESYEGYRYQNTYKFRR